MRASDVVVSAHYEDKASTEAHASFERMKQNLRGLESQTKSLQKSGSETSETMKKLGTVLGGLITLEMAKKLAMFTVEVTRLSTEGNQAVDRLSKSWSNLEKTMGTVFAKPLATGFQEAGKVLDGFSVQLEAFNVLYHKVFGGVAETPTIDRLGGIRRPEIAGPKAELAKMIRQAQLDEKLNAIGEDVQRQIDAEREQKKREAEARAKTLKGLESQAGPLSVRGGQTADDRLRIANAQKAAKEKTELGRLFYLTGETTAQQLALGYKQGLEANQTDFTSPAARTATASGEVYRGAFVDVLAQSYEDLLTGDFELSLKGLGTRTKDMIVGSFAGGMARATTKELGLDSLDALFDAAGGRAVGYLSGAIKGGLRALPESDEVRRFGEQIGGKLKGAFDVEWGAGGGTFGTVQTGVTNALKGGVVGAGVGVLVAGEFAAQQAAIGGILGRAIGDAFGQGTAGAAAGGLIAGLLNKAFGDDYDKNQNRNYRDLLTDVQAFGGLKGFFGRIGGFSGLRGGRADVFFDSDKQDELADLIRVTVGATKEQANGVLAVLRGQAAKNIDPSVSGRAVGVSADLQPQVLNTLRALGFSEEQIQSVRFAGVSGGSAFPPPSAPPPTTPPPSVPAIVPPTPVKIAGDLLRQAMIDKTLSAGALKALGWSGVVSQAINDVGGLWPSVGSSVKTVLNYGKGGSPQDEAFIKRTLGVDVVAAQGFAGTVSQPTRFLAGEAGPEDVMVIPHSMRRGVTGGGVTGGGQPVLNLSLSISTPNVESMRTYVEREMWPMVKELMWRKSNDGEPLMRSRGVVN